VVLLSIFSLCLLSLECCKAELLALGNGWWECGVRVAQPESCFSPVSAQEIVSVGLPSVAAAGFWPGIVRVSRCGHHWDVVLPVLLPSRCAGNMFPTPAEGGVAASCIPLQRCRLRWRPRPHATVAVAMGLGASVVMKSNHGCAAGVDEGGPDLLQ